MSSQDQQLSGKVFLVTGASSGIGEALVIKLASQGASVNLCGQNEGRLDLVQQRCVKESGGHAERFNTVQGDLQQADVRRRSVQATLDRFGKLDVLVTNAGLNTPEGGILNATEESYDTVMGVNVKSVFFLIQEAVPHLEKTKGCIVSVSSVGSAMPMGANIVYPMSKAAIDHMTRCLSIDLAPKGIRVNAVNPSFIPTRIRRFVGDEEANRKAVTSIAEVQSKLHPLEGRCVTVDEVAEAILFLASEKAGFITGECMPVDGGRRMIGQAPVATTQTK